MRNTFFLITVLLMSISAYARGFVFEGLRYAVIDEEKKTCRTAEGYMSGGQNKPGNTVEGDISIPAIVSDGTDEYTVVQIGKYSFVECSDLNTIILPNTVTSIGNGAFENCARLRHVSLSNSLESIGYGAFEYCVRLESISIPYCLKSIDGYAFKNCGLKSIELPNSVTYLGQGAFRNCTNLKSVKLSDFITALNEETFLNCKNLTSVNVPENLTVLYNYVFEGCQNLSSIIIPASVTKIKQYAFTRSLIGKIYFLCSVKEFGEVFEHINTDVSIFCKSDEIDYVKEIYNGNVYILDPYDISFEPLICGVRFMLNETPSEIYKDGGLVTFHRVQIYENDETQPITIEADANKEYLIKELAHDTKYKIVYSWANLLYNGRVIKEMRTKIPSAKYEATQTTLTFDLNDYADASVKPDAFDFSLEFMEDIYHEFDKPVKISNLVPDRTYFAKLQAKYGDYILKQHLTLNTAPIEISISHECGPTSISLSASCNPGDAKVIRTWWADIDKSTDNPAVITGLTPNTAYTYTYHVETEDGSIFKNALNVKTADIVDFALLTPTCTSSSAAIVRATTNISEAETRVGFQWRKYDAPESLPSSEGYAAIYNGTLEGRIKSLQPNTYYNVRAFYKDMNERYYYSEWATFDSSDFSYMDPTIHTYPIQYTESNSVTLKGYVLGGTDDITNQGFQYWAIDDGNKKIKLLTTQNGENTIIATGQIMSATIDNMDAGSYAYRIFVETASGFYYGEEQFFDIKGASFVNNLHMSDDKPEIAGYVDVTGRIHNMPQQGFNIILYTNGRTEKIIIRK